jgi:4-hydroxy-tetrahydrodipicolinate synthase
MRGAERTIDSGSGPQFVAAALTALDSRRRFDDAMAKDYLSYLAAGGLDGVLVLGTTGEFASFSVKERKQILESYIKHRGKLSVMAQVGAPNLPETLELLAHAADAGAGSALVLPPFYYKNVSTEGVLRYYEPVLDAARIPPTIPNRTEKSNVGTNRSKESASGRERHCR